jgi:transposase InsO family protein
MVWLWHRRLGHVGIKQLNKLIKHDLVRGLKDVTFEKGKLCSACQAGKQVGNTHPKKSMMSTSKPFELLHMDLFGPTTYTSIGGNKYGFVIVDDFTRYTWVLFLVDKSDVFATFKTFIKKIHNEFETTIKKVTSDNGSEFKNTRVDDLLSEYNVSHSFWVEAINTAWYYSNRLYCHPTMEKTPYELLNEKSPILHTLGYLDASAIY